MTSNQLHSYKAHTLLNNSLSTVIQSDWLLLTSYFKSLFLLTYHRKELLYQISNEPSLSTATSVACISIRSEACRLLPQQSPIKAISLNLLISWEPLIVSSEARLNEKTWQRYRILYRGLLFLSRLFLLLHILALQMH
jgi:hypothetical protein